MLSKPFFSMCISPIHIRNPYYLPPQKVIREYKYNSLGRKVTIKGEPVVVCDHPFYNSMQKRFTDTGKAFFKENTQFIDVPCGTCPECARAHQRNFVQRSQMESMYSYDFMATLTYDDKHLPKLVCEAPARSDAPCLCPYPDLDDDCQTPATPLYSLDGDGPGRESYDDAYIDLSDFQGPPDVYPEPVHIEYTAGMSAPVGNVDVCEIPYAEVHDVQLLFKRLRDNVMTLPEFAGRKLSYLAVSELGEEKGRPHFHICFKISKLASDFISGQVAPVASKHVLKPGIIENLESILYNKVREYWSVNIGTRKNPIYEPRFTFRKKYVNGKLFKNYDLHWVDPLNAKDTASSDDVTYYVTKYALKDNPHELRRKAFFFARFNDDDAKAFYRCVRSRLLVSKGFGVDNTILTNYTFSFAGASFRKSSIELPIPSGLSKCMLSCFIPFGSDPLNFYRVYRDKKVFLRVVYLVESSSLKKTTHRKFIPNTSITSRILANSDVDAGQFPYPIFIDTNGKHRPLGEYYRHRGDCYDYAHFFNVNINVTQEMIDTARSRWDSPDDVKAVFTKRSTQYRDMYRNMSFEQSLTLANLHTPVNNPIYE